MFLSATVILIRLLVASADTPLSLHVTSSNPADVFKILLYSGGGGDRETVLLSHDSHSAEARLTEIDLRKVFISARGVCDT